ncbi:hypothetical protein C2G38_2066065 [Gigaspora rosea]|uniref:Uncharacterized protein n=1 Tax=Gigaspora rosea TaxID=44941 RepID=A0A397VXD6_9GLOM|nr:hypothetical protein C2G38_2066065 [Gigaspora rosea]
MNTALISLNLSFNNLESEGEKALADALLKNTTLAYLNIRSIGAKLLNLKFYNQNIEIIQ